MKKTQHERIVGKLLRDGYVTRNEALRNFISRLGAIICNLQRDGWEFTAKYEGTDYVYTVTKCPLRKSSYTLPDGKIIITYSK